MTIGREPGVLGPRSYLAERSPVSEKIDALVHDGLFREFSDLLPGTEEILAFAGRYGMLGAYALVAPVKRESGGANRVAGWTGESIETWQAEIGMMYRLVRMWDSIEGKIRAKQHDLEQSVRYLPHQIVYGWTSPHDEGLEVVASEVLRPWLFARLNATKDRDPFEVMRWYLQIAVNEKLNKTNSSARLLWDRHWKKLGLSVAPTNLIGFLWLQLAKAIEGNISHRRCDDCGKWFPLGGRAGRADKRFCSGTCKARSHRLRR